VGQRLIIGRLNVDSGSLEANTRECAEDQETNQHTTNEHRNRYQYLDAAHREQSGVIAMTKPYPSDMAGLSLGSIWQLGPLHPLLQMHRPFTSGRPRTQNATKSCIKVSPLRKAKSLNAKLNCYL